MHSVSSEMFYSEDTVNLFYFPSNSPGVKGRSAHDKAGSLS